MFYTLLTNYNNYYNRTFKKENTVAEYIAKADSYITKNDKSYNINFEDEINIEQVFNVEFDGEPNYILLLNESDSSINSRYFIVEWKRTRKGQYKGLLRRDLLADYYNIITKAPAFIEKGYVDNINSLAWQKEDMTFNQIKKVEASLLDDSKTSWIVGYVAQDHTALTDETFTLNPEVDLVVASDHLSWSYAGLCDGTQHTTLDNSDPDSRIRYILKWANIAEYRYEFMMSQQGSGSAYRIYPHQAADYWDVDYNHIWDYVNGNWISSFNWRTMLDKIITDNSWASIDDYNFLKSLVGRKIQFNDGIYTLTLTSDIKALQNDWSYWDSGELYNYIYPIVNEDLQSIGDRGIIGVYRYPVAYKMMRQLFAFNFVPVENVSGTYKYSIPQTVRKLEDSPYKMFCIPYYKYKVTTNPRYQVSLDGTTYFYCDESLMMSWALDIAKKFSNHLYDLQILPYCPLSNWRGRTGTTNAAVWAINKSQHVDYEYLTETIDGTTHSKGIVFFCDVSTKEQVLTNNLISIGNAKEQSQYMSARLCSPNYASVFEFNPAYNNGVSSWNIRYTYKPFQPFIQVAPNFGGLYGRDFKDNRGLICAGDFSLPIVTDAWIQYQLNNKNYQLAFDRQIENMETQYNWQHKQNVASAITGILQGGTAGGMAGGMAGGVPGAIAGAVIGTGAAITGGAMDLQMQDALHNEAIDFTKDNFGFQMQNIQALPNTLNKVSSIVANSKLFPFVEIYYPTSEEIEALRNKIKYNGMTIGRIGKIEDYLNPSDTTYVKGQLIRIEGAFDTRTANEMANEFMKGWYI